MNRFATALDLIKCLKQIKKQRLILACELNSEIPSNISTKRCPLPYLYTQTRTTCPLKGTNWQISMYMQNGFGSVRIWIRDYKGPVCRSDQNPLKKTEAIGIIPIIIATKKCFGLYTEPVLVLYRVVWIQNHYNICSNKKINSWF